MGEKQGTRENIDKMTGRLVQSGISPERAKQIATNSARRHEGERVQKIYPGRRERG